MQIMMKITTFELLNLLVVKLQPLSRVNASENIISAFHSLSSLKNSVILWYVMHLAYVKMLIKSRETMFVLKSEIIFMCALVNSVACHTVTVCKICKSTCSHTIFSRKILFETKSEIFMSIWVIKFSISQFHICNLSFAMFIRKHDSATPWIVKLSFMQI